MSQEANENSVEKSHSNPFDESLSDTFKRVLSSKYGIMGLIIRCLDYLGMDSHIVALAEKALRKVDRSFLSGKDLLYMIKVLERDTYKALDNLVLEVMANLAEFTCYKRMEDEEYVDSPTSYFLLRNGEYIRYLQQRKGEGKEFSFMCWFYPAQYVENMEILELPIGNYSLQVDTTEYQNVRIRVGNKDVGVIEKAVNFFTWNSFAVSMRSSKKMVIFSRKTEVTIYLNGKHIVFDSYKVDFNGFTIGALPESKNRTSSPFCGFVSKIICLGK